MLKRVYIKCVVVFCVQFSVSTNSL